MCVCVLFPASNIQHEAYNAAVKLMAVKALEERGGGCEPVWQLSSSEMESDEERCSSHKATWLRKKEGERGGQQMTNKVHSIFVVGDGGVNEEPR